MLNKNDITAIKSVCKTLNVEVRSYSGRGMLLMSNIKEHIKAFHQGVDSGAIRMTVDHDCGHAYNGWTGQLWDFLSDMIEEIGGDDLDEWEEVTNERLSEDDPGLLCVPDFINTLIKEDGGKTPGNDRVTSCECQCPDEHFNTVEDSVQYLQDFMKQQEEMNPDNLEHSRKWFRFDLMERYIKENKK